MQRIVEEIRDQIVFRQHRKIRKERIERAEKLQTLAIEREKVRKIRDDNEKVEKFKSIENKKNEMRKIAEKLRKKILEDEEYKIKTEDRRILGVEGMKLLRKRKRGGHTKYYVKETRREDGRIRSNTREQEYKREDNCKRRKIKGKRRITQKEEEEKESGSGGHPPIKENKVTNEKNRETES